MTAHRRSYDRHRQRGARPPAAPRPHPGEHDADRHYHRFDNGFPAEAAEPDQGTIAPQAVPGIGKPPILSHRHMQSRPQPAAPHQHEKWGNHPHAPPLTQQHHPEYIRQQSRETETRSERQPRRHERVVPIRRRYEPGACEHQSSRISMLHRHHPQHHENRPEGQQRPQLQPPHRHERTQSQNRAGHQSQRIADQHPFLPHFPPHAYNPNARPSCRCAEQHTLRDDREWATDRPAPTGIRDHGPHSP